MKKISQLTLASMLFPIFLVLYEFSVYIANDMIQPAMLAVVNEFTVSPSWIPTALTCFLIGGGLITWLLGPLSDRYGRRPMMLMGVAGFILSCLAILLVGDIHGFMVLRVLQGIGMGFISAVGYAVIQEAYEEHAAIKVMALMANVSLIAPLLGPLLGAMMISIAPWRWIFVVIALCAGVSAWGLWRYMPETIDRAAQDAALHEDHFMVRLVKNYRQIFSQASFLRAAVVPPLVALPILAWIGVAPMILMSDFHLTPMAFGLLQIPVFVSMIIGNLLVARVTGRWPLDRTLNIGLYLMIAAAILGVVGVLLTKSYWPLVIATTVGAMTDGLSMSTYYRFAITASHAAKGLAAAAVNLVFMSVFAIGVELYNLAYTYGGALAYALLTVVVTWLVVRLAKVGIKEAMDARS